MLLSELDDNAAECTQDLHDQSVFAAIALAPIFIWELSIGLWMTFKGVQSLGTGRARLRGGAPGRVVYK